MIRLGDDRILPVPIPPGLLFGYGDGVGGDPGGGNLPKPKAKWTLLDDFEDGDIAEYSGNPTMFGVGTDEHRRGSYALYGTFPSDNGIYRTDITCAQGDRLRFWGLKNLAGGSCEMLAFGFGCTDTTTGYWAAFNYGSEKIQLWEGNPISGTLHAEAAFTFDDDEWYQGNIKWQTDGNITFEVDTTEITKTDTTFTTGGFGWYSQKSGPSAGVCWADWAQIKVGSAG